MSAPEQAPSGPRPGVCVDTGWPRQHVSKPQCRTLCCRSRRRKELTQLISTGSVLFARGVHDLGLQPGVWFVGSMATPCRPPVMSVARGGPLTGVQGPAVTRVEDKARLGPVFFWGPFAALPTSGPCPQPLAIPSLLVFELPTAPLLALPAGPLCHARLCKFLMCLRFMHLPSRPWLSSPS